MSKRYLNLKKRPTAAQSPFVSGSPSSKKTEKKDRELMEKLLTWEMLNENKNEKN